MVIVYPTQADADGWFFAAEGDQALCIETRTDADENVFKRVALTRGRTAILRELTSKESKTAQSIGGKNQDLVLDAYLALCATITDTDGTIEKFVAEDIEGWKAKDTNRLRTAAYQLNF